MSTSTSAPSSPTDIQALLAYFARSRGVPNWKLYHALNRRRGRSRARGTQSPALLPVHIVESMPAAQAGCLEILLVGGCRIRVGQDFDARLLGRVIESLGPC